MIARTHNGQDRRPFGAGILDPAPALPAEADPRHDWQPTDADVPAEVVTTGPDSEDLVGPWLTLPEWVEAQAGHYRRMGSGAALMVAVILDELASSIRFHRASSPAEYLDHVAILRPSVEDMIPEDFDTDNPLW